MSTLWIAHQQIQMPEIHKQQLISSHGTPGPIMIVGDYPTMNEYNSGNTFSGPPGNLISSLCKPYNIDTRRIFKTHYFKVPISGYSSPNKKIKEESVAKIQTIEDWDSILRSEIQAVNPNVILSLGELALRSLTGESGIKKWRGSILPLADRFSFPNIKVIPTHSPREIWEQNDAPFVYCQWDCGKLLLVKDQVSQFIPDEIVWIARNHLELSNWWQRAKYGDFLTLDIETHHGFITCIGFSHDGKEAVSVPLLVGNRLDYHERGAIYSLIDTILRSPIPKVNQNIKYDWSVLENYGFTINNIIGDTMLMAHTIYPELPKGLDFLNSIYTELPYYKDEGRKFNPRLHSVDRLLKYNARDALCTHQIWTKQIEDAKTIGVLDFYHKNVHPAFFIYKKMDQLGIQVDETQRQKLLEKYTPQLFDLKVQINLVAEEKININSPTQVAHFVYDILKCPKETHKTDAGDIKLSTGEDILEELYVNKISDIGRKTLLKQLIIARKLSRILQFLKAPISADGRMRTSYKLHGTETGRTSAGKSLEPHYSIENGVITVGECGGSFQTIPKRGIEFGSERIGGDLRSIYIPRPGYCFIEGDQAGAEDRVVCVLAEDWDGLAILNKKEFLKNSYGLKDDRHTLTACLITGKPFEKITPDDRQERGKKPRHAGNYNIGSKTLALFTHLSQIECKHLLDTFHSTNPKIRGIFQARIREQINNTRFLVSPHGRRRDFFGRITEDTFKQAFANIPQATVSDHNKFTILRTLVELYPEPLTYPVAESHDSNMFEVRLDIKEQFMESFHKACETPISFLKCCISRDYNLVIPGDITWSDKNWQEMEKMK